MQDRSKRGQSAAAPHQDDAILDPARESVFLIGPGGVGKTTIGPHLASRLGYDFVDLDDYFWDADVR